MRKRVLLLLLCLCLLPGVNVCAYSLREDIGFSSYYDGMYEKERFETTIEYVTDTAHFFFTYKNPDKELQIQYGTTYYDWEELTFTEAISVRGNSQLDCTWKNENCFLPVQWEVFQYIGKTRVSGYYGYEIIPTGYDKEKGP